MFRLAILESAAAVLCAHNHPSGNPEPSEADVVVTRQLADAGRIVGIPLRDHLIIAGAEFYRRWKTRAAHTRNAGLTNMIK